MKINRIQDISIKGIRKMQQEQVPFEEQVQKIVKTLSDRAEREVPEYGDFRMVYETLKSPDKNMQATDFALKIVRPNLPNSEKLRGLEAVAFDASSGYKCECVMKKGSKADVLKALKEENFAQKVKETFESLSKSLEDI